MIAPTPRVESQRDSGASLVLALVFLLAIGVLILTMATFAVGAQSNAINLKAERTVRANAASAATVAIQQVRVAFDSLDYSGTPAVCAPSWVTTSYSFTVYCQGTLHAGSPSTRTVNFFVCATTVSATNCTVAGSTAVALAATVTYDDVPPAQPAGALCSNSSDATCGLTMTIDQWDVRLADG